MHSELLSILSDHGNWPADNLDCCLSSLSKCTHLLRELDEERKKATGLKDSPRELLGTDPVEARLDNLRTFLASCPLCESKVTYGVIMKEPVVETEEISRGSGAVAVQPISAGETVIKVPKRLFFSVQFGYAADTYEMREFLSSHLCDNSSLQLAVLTAHAMQRPDHFWRPYLQALPSSFSVPLYWQISDFKRIANISTRFRAISSIRAAMLLYLRADGSTKKEGAKLATSAGTKRNNPVLNHGLSWALFKWSMSVIITRQNHIPYLTSSGEQGDALCLVPGWDMLNHKIGAMNTEYDATQDTLIYRAMEDVEEGQEVFMCYGQRSSEQMLLFSGFVDGVKNPYDEVTIDLEIPEDELSKVRRLVGAKYRELRHGASASNAKSGSISSRGVQCVLRSNSFPLPCDVIFAALTATATKEELVTLMRGTEEFVTNISESQSSLEYLKMRYSVGWTEKALAWLEGALDEVLCVLCEGVAVAKATTITDLDVCFARLNTGQAILVEAGLRELRSVIGAEDIGPDPER